jgi:DNA-binding response OmpR family regulator
LTTAFCRTVPIMANVMVVEDEGDIRESLRRGLVRHGHAVSTCPTGLDALQRLADSDPDVVLLDLGLPDVDGLQVLRMLRGISDVPVIVITARDDEGVIITALDTGADDYVVKPFGLDHVAARIRAVIRRRGTSADDEEVRVGELVITPGGRQVHLAGAPVDLTRKEFDMLLTLALRAGSVVSKQTLLAEVWQQAYGGGDRSVDVHLSWLRRKLGESAAEPRYLHTVRGVGIKLVAPDLTGT